MTPLLVAALLALVASRAAAAPGDVVWSLASGEQNVGSTPALAPDGTVYVGGADGTLFALRYDGSVASIVWRFHSGGSIGASPLVGPDGRVYFGSFDGKLYALSADGKKLWSFTTGARISSSPARAVDGTLYVGSADGNLYALSPTGSELWQYATGGEVGSSPAIGSDGTIYVGSADGVIRALSPAGAQLWSYSTGQSVVSPAVGIGGRVYAGSFNGRLYALNPSDGTLQWSYDTGGRIAGAPATATDGSVYITSFDTGQLVALSYGGTLEWKYPAGPSVLSVYASPAVGADGTVYFGAYGGILSAVRATGALKWTYSTGADWIASPAIAPDGTVYCGTFDGTYRALSDDSGGPMASIWPMFGRDALHSRRAIDSDNDADQILDSWEQLFAAAGLSPTNGADALLDPDRDTISNRDEARRGLSPSVPNDPVSGAPLTIVPGDVAPLGAQDGVVNLADAMVLIRLIENPAVLAGLTPGQRVLVNLAGDANNDQKLDAADGLLLLKRVTGGP